MKIINNKKEAIKELTILLEPIQKTILEIKKIVEGILQDVKDYGDIAVEKFTKKFDGFNPSPMQVSEDHIKNARDGIDNNLKRSLEVAIKELKIS